MGIHNRTGNLAGPGLQGHGLEQSKDAHAKGAEEIAKLLTIEVVTKNGINIENNLLQWKQSIYDEEKRHEKGIYRW